MPAQKAHAKINWFLRVRGKRADGYHDIESLFHRITLCDELTFEHAHSISLMTEASIPGDENLVMKAALSMREASGANKGARISLIKNIPIAAGLGGGSSDAAATLTGLNSLWGLDMPRERLHKLALSLGSDVPFFLDGPAQMASGRGETLSPVDVTKSYTLLLLNPGIAVSAGWAYSQVKKYSSDDQGYAESFIAALNSGDFRSLREIAVNDLEAPVVRAHPAVGELKEGLIKAGAHFAAMSGSGPTVFGVFSDSKQAEDAISSIKAPWSAIAKTINILV